MVQKEKNEREKIEREKRKKEKKKKKKEKTKLTGCPTGTLSLLNCIQRPKFFNKI